MESLKRTIMLLKPSDNRMTVRGKNAGTLRIEATIGGVAVALKTDCLQPGKFVLYLFLKGGTEHFAGTVLDGELFATLDGISLGDIEGAAVVHSEDRNHTFCLTTKGLDWPRVIERFRIAQMQQDAARSQTQAQSAPPEEEGQQSASELPASDGESAEIQESLPTVEAEDFVPADEDTIEKYHVEMTEPTEDESPAACPHVTRQIKINPFPSVFPTSAWVKISYPGPTGWWHYISGTIYKNNEVAAKVLGVPGEYGMAPPIWLEGFGTYMRCVGDDAKGYWLMFQDAETGEVLDRA